MDQIFTMTTTFDLVPKVIKTKIAEVIKEQKTTILNWKREKVTKKTNTEYRHIIYNLQAHNIKYFLSNLVYYYISRFRLLHKQLVLHKRLISYYASGCYYISSWFFIPEAVEYYISRDYYISSCYSRLTFLCYYISSQFLITQAVVLHKL